MDYGRASLQLRMNQRNSDRYDNKSDSIVTIRESYQGIKSMNVLTVTVGVSDSL